MEIETLIGLVAGTLTTFSFIPQLIKIIIKKRADEISTAMYSVISTGMFLWIIYGIMINSLPVILANTISVILCVIIIVFKFYYEKMRSRMKGEINND